MCWCVAQHDQHRVRKPSPQDMLLGDGTQAQLTVRIHMVINELGSCFLIVFFFLLSEIIIILFTVPFLPFKCFLLAFTSHTLLFPFIDIVCVPKYTNTTSPVCRMFTCSHMVSRADHVVSDNQFVFSSSRRPRRRS